jgi:peptide/nickel transport system substrate-binding protein
MQKKWFWISLLLLLLIVPVQAQSNTQGLVVLPYSFSMDSEFKPLRCAKGNCPQDTYLLNELLFPRTLAIDPQTHTFTTGTFENNGLVHDWSYSDDLLTITLNLRDDARWSDGTPITAKDVIYSLLNTRASDIDSKHGPIISFKQVDDDTLQVTMHEANCNTINLLAEFVVPAHNWRYSAELDPQSVVTGGRYRVVDYDPDTLIRLEPVQQGPLIEFRRGAITSARDFRKDDPFAIFPNVPLYERHPLEIAGAQFRSVLKNQSVALWFNTANSWNPQPAFDPETGERIEQEPNVFFADRNMRLAVAHLIDIDGIITDGFYGDATSIPSTMPPTSWAANSDLTRYAYDFDLASRLLQDAGWHFVDNRAPRVCIDCGTAPEGTPLQITLAYDMSNMQDYRIMMVADAIGNALWRAGFSVDVADADYVTSQRFDLAILSMTNRYPATPDNPLVFTPEEDDPNNYGQNFTSYYNETVTDLLLEAQTVPGCVVDTRRELYGQAQAILHDEIVTLGLYAPYTVMAAQPSLQHYNPQPEQPFWQVTEWAVWND